DDEADLLGGDLVSVGVQRGVGGPQDRHRADRDQDVAVAGRPAEIDDAAGQALVHHYHGSPARSHLELDAGQGGHAACPVAGGADEEVDFDALPFAAAHVLQVGPADPAALDAESHQ